MTDTLNGPCDRAESRRSSKRLLVRSPSEVTTWCRFVKSPKSSG